MHQNTVPLKGIYVCPHVHVSVPFDKGAMKTAPCLKGDPPTHAAHRRMKKGEEDV